MADYAFKGYDNFVLQEKIDSIISTKLDMNKFMTADYSLVEQPGMVKKIHVYKPSGQAYDLDRGEGISNWIDAEYVEREYRVKRTQDGCKYYDDDQMTDPTLIDTKLRGVAEVMINNWTDKAIAEYNKSWNQSVMTNYELADWADAIAKYTNKYEDQAGLFFLCDIALVPTIRKVLGDYLKYTEDYIRTGAIGDILGVPIYTSKALPKGIIFLAHKDAVHAFLKKNTFVEQDRDINTKENRVIAARYSVIALYDESKCVKMGKAMSTPATITTYTAGAKTVAGAATTGAKVTLFINGVKDGNPVTAVSNAYTFTAAENLVADDKVMIVVEKDGFLPETVEVTVA